MKRQIVSLFVVAWALGRSAAAFAQVGSGWVQYQPPSVIHLDGANGIEVSPGTSTDVRNQGASFTNQGGIETFTLFNPISNRAERRVQNTYLAGRHQFEGEVRVSPPTNDESVMQIFGGNSGATTQMIRAFDEGNGTLKKMPGSVAIAQNIHGVWIKVNVIHDVGANYVKTYINGKLVTTGDGEAMNAGTDGWYHKYGCYGSLRTAMAKVEWRNVKHFKDGNDPAAADGGAANPMLPDAAAQPDAGSGEDAAQLADAGGGSGGGDGGSGGSGGKGGSAGSGTGGAGGSGPVGGSGGHASTGGAGEEAPTGDEGGSGGGGTRARHASTGGCAYAGRGNGAAVALLLALALVLGRRRR
jgi:hypothetical protein